MSKKGMLKRRLLVPLCVVAAACAVPFSSEAQRPPRGEGSAQARLGDTYDRAKPWKSRPGPRSRQAPLWQLQQALPAPQMEEDPGAPVVDVAAAAALTPLDPGDLDPTIDVQITQEIIDKAAELGSVEAMYEFVRNECAFQAYYGSQKGSVETLRQRAGNDYDLASLLIALLRASDIPARYAVGEVEMSVDRATSWLAVDDGWVAGSILFTKGLEGLIIVSGPDVVAIRARRVWVEAFVPRGYGSSTWVPLDPAFALTTIHEGIDIPEEMGLDAQALVDEYWDPSDPGVILPREETILQLLEQDIQEYLDVNYPGMTVNEVMRAHEVIPESLGLLPGSLPYTVRSRDMTFSEIPADRRYQIRMHLHDGGMNLIDHTMNLPEIAGRRITIDYIGATPTDEAIIDSYGGIYQTPPSLVDLKPVLRVDGVEAAVGATGLGMGVYHESDVHFLAPVNGSGLPQNMVPAIYNGIICGASQAIGLAVEGASEGLLVEPPEDDTEGTLPMLYDTAMDYMASVRNGDLRLGGFMHSYVTTGVTSAILENVVTVTGSGFDWKGLRVDADRSIVGVWPVDEYPPGDEPKDFLIIGGADGSVWEHHIFETGFNQDSVSTIKILELAVDAGVTVYKRWSTLPLPANTQPAHVRTAIENAIYYYGHVVTFPADPLTVGTPVTGEWTGTGWIDMDLDTGAAGYIISGGNNGGATVEVWPPEFIDLQEGDRSVVQVEIEITKPSADSPDASAIFTRDNEEHIEFEYLLHVTYDDASTATLGPYKRTTRNTTKTFVPGNYTFHIWIARFWWWWGALDHEERKVSIVGVLIREDDGTDLGKDPPKFIQVKPPAPETPPQIDIMALVIPEKAPNGTTLASSYAWTGDAKLKFVPTNLQKVKLEPNSEQPSGSIDDQEVNVVVGLPGGKQSNGFAKLNFAQGGSDEKHKMTVYRAVVKAEDGTSDPPGFVGVGKTQKLKAVLDPTAVAGEFENWTTTSTKVTLSHPGGKEIVAVNAGNQESNAIEDEEIVPNFKPDGASAARPHPPHKMTVYKVEITIVSGATAVGDGTATPDHTDICATRRGAGDVTLEGKPTPNIPDPDNALTWDWTGGTAVGGAPRRRTVSSAAFVKQDVELKTKGAADPDFNGGASSKMLTYILGAEPTAVATSGVGYADNEEQAVATPLGMNGPTGGGGDYSSGITIQYTIKPDALLADGNANLFDRTDVLWDVSRDKRVGYWHRVTDANGTKWDLFDDRRAAWASDDTLGDGDEDNNPWNGSGHLYGNDKPGWSGAGGGGDWLVSKLNMREWVRVGLGGTTGRNGIICSDYSPWRAFRSIQDAGANWVNDNAYDNELTDSNAFWGNVPPNPIVVNAGSDQNIAPAGSVLLQANVTGGQAPLTYAWTPVGGLDNPAILQPTASPATTTTYTLTVTDPAGQSARDSVVVTVALVANAGPDQNISAGGSVTLQASVAGGQAPLTYSWTPTAELDDPTILQPTASPAATTTYTLTVNGSAGQSANDSVVVTVAP